MKQPSNKKVVSNSSFIPAWKGGYMTKKDLVEIIAKKSNLPKNAARDVVSVMIAVIKDCLVRDEKVVITGFGTFSVRHRKERVGRNPATGRPITLKARKGVGFTPGKPFKRAVSG